MRAPEIATFSRDAPSTRRKRQRRQHAVALGTRIRLERITSVAGE